VIFIQDLLDVLTLADIATDDVLESAYNWLCTRRKDWSAGSDVWRLRHHWSVEKAQLREELLAGTYEVGLLTRVTLSRNGTQEELDLWSARDALVMKALSLILPQYLPLSEHCTHLKGHGGAKYAVRQVIEHVPASTFVLKTDVQSYYASIDHHLLLDRLAVYIPDRDVLNLIAQYLQRCAERGGLFWDYRKGIALGSSLSPIIGAFFLTELDGAFEKLGLFYKRFMDDIVVLAPTRWKLRTAVKVVNQVLASLGLAKHPEKTFIGRIEEGFDWLGYHISPYGLSVATKTLQNFVTRSLRLYEQELREGETSSQLGDYVRRWVRWVSAGVAAGTSAVLCLPGLGYRSQALPPR
jgi:retron-type reverse transcriptase